MERANLIIEPTLIGNKENPHFFICSGWIDMITKDTVLYEFSYFKNQAAAQRYCKRLGKSYFPKFASQDVYKKLLKYGQIQITKIKF